MVGVVALGGDGTGPEVLEHGLRVLRVVEEWSGLPFKVESIECGGQYECLLSSWRFDDYQ